VTSQPGWGPRFDELVAAVHARCCAGRDNLQVRWDRNRCEHAAQFTLAAILSDRLVVTGGGAVIVACM
jgi:hypothetical protein